LQITEIYVKNFKSIKELTFCPTKYLNAFIGSNNSGKTNLFSAINFVLGERYPTFNSISKDDYYKGNDDDDMCIKISFDDGNYLEFTSEWETPYRQIKSGLNMSGNYCNNENRQKYCSAYVGVRREINDYMPSNKWTLMGRFLQEVNAQFLEERLPHEDKMKSDELKEQLNKIRDELLFSVEDRSGKNVMETFLSIIKEETSKQISGSDCDFDIHMNMYDPWNYYRSLQFVASDHTMGLDLKASQLGMGLQASLTIAILKAYAQLKLRNQPPIFIDEPELFLHPHAERNFYSVLRELAENGTQVFYTTHSPSFLSVKHFDEIFVVRKRNAETYLKFANINNFVQDLSNRKGITSSEEDLKLHYANAYENTGNSKEANEAFFANKIILVEGQSESLLLPYFFEKKGYEYLKEGISIVCCGSKGELDRFYRLYSEFGIPCYIIFDGDKQLEGTDEERANIGKNKDLISLLDSGGIPNYPDNTPHDKYLGFEKTLEYNLGFDTSKKGLDLFLQFKKKYESKEVQIPSWVDSLIDQVSKLDGESESILQL